MISTKDARAACDDARGLLGKTSIGLSENELASMTAADFGLSRVRTEGLQVITLIETGRIGMKVLVLLAGQTMVEHRHPRRGDDPGKEETLRCLWGTCRVYVPGTDTMKEGYIPDGQDRYYSCRNEIILEPAEQYTFEPGVPHWFQPGSQGCVVLSLSTRVTDLDDQFTNPKVVRKTVYIDDT